MAGYLKLTDKKICRTSRKTKFTRIMRNETPVTGRVPIPGTPVLRDHAYGTCVRGTSVL